MRLILQRVKKASVEINQQVHNKIKNGLLVYIGITHRDTNEDIKWLCRKMSQLRIFNDEQGVMNKSLIDVKGEVLFISQFTLYANCKKGNRPSYIDSAKPETAEPLYNEFINYFKNELSSITLKTGVFGADMQISSVNDGPVTIILDSKFK